MFNRYGDSVYYQIDGIEYPIYQIQDNQIYMERAPYCGYFPVSLYDNDFIWDTLPRFNNVMQAVKFIKSNYKNFL